MAASPPSVSPPDSSQPVTHSLFLQRPDQPRAAHHSSPPMECVMNKEQSFVLSPAASSEISVKRSFETMEAESELLHDAETDIVPESTLAMVLYRPPISATIVVVVHEAKRQKSDTSISLSSQHVKLGFDGLSDLGDDNFFDEGDIEDNEWIEFISHSNPRDIMCMMRNSSVWLFVMLDRRGRNLNLNSNALCHCRRSILPCQPRPLLHVNCPG